jgi:hypothetical protein
MEAVLYGIAVAIVVAGLMSAVNLFLLKRWISGVDVKFGGIFKRLGEISEKVAEHEGFHKGLNAKGGP